MGSQQSRITGNQLLGIVLRSGFKNVHFIVRHQVRVSRVVIHSAHIYEVPRVFLKCKKCYADDIRAKCIADGPVLSSELVVHSEPLAYLI